MMKEIGSAIGQMEQEEIAGFERQGKFQIHADNKMIELTLEDVEIISEDIPGWLVANEGAITVALDINITKELRQEGLARELINRIQNIRKESGFEVTDKISILIEKHDLINDAIGRHGEYIGSQTLADNISLTDRIDNNKSKRIDIDDDVYINIRITRA
jgi:isoleucyl-tRNA synthetase